MKNLNTSIPDCLGTPENRPGWAGLAGLAAQVANVGSMEAQVLENSPPNGKIEGGVLAPTRELLSGPGPPTRVYY